MGIIWASAACSDQCEHLSSRVIQLKSVRTLSLSVVRAALTVGKIQTVRTIVSTAQGLAQCSQRGGTDGQHNSITIMVKLKEGEVSPLLAVYVVTHHLSA